MIRGTQYPERPRDPVAEMQAARQGRAATDATMARVQRSPSESWLQQRNGLLGIRVPNNAAKLLERTPMTPQNQRDAIKQLTELLDTNPAAVEEMQNTLLQRAHDGSRAAVGWSRLIERALAR
jgi:hypothetical protein